MRRCTAVGLFGALTLGLLGMAEVESAAPPRLAPARLDADQQRQVNALMAQAARALEAGRFEEALARQRQAVALRERWLGKRHWQTIHARLALEGWQRLVKVPLEDRGQVIRAFRVNGEGVRLVGLGRYRAAEAKLREALAIRLGALGEGHPDVAGSYNNLAFCLNAQGQHAQALALYEKALAIERKALGEESPETATGYSNVATCLNDQRQYVRALPLHEKALAISRKALGEGHPDTAISYNNLAYCLNAQGQHACALPLLEKALAIRLEVLGEDHPDTALSYNNLALCLRDQGLHAQALPLYQKGLTICRKALGEDHPHTATCYGNVAFCLHAQGRPVNAQLLFERALAIHRTALGEGHPNTATAYNNVATCLQAQGQHAQALPLFERALAIHRKALGEAHPATATSYNNVAFSLQAQGKPGEAQPLFEKALTIYRKALGEGHLRTAIGYNNVAFSLHRQGHHAEAQPLLEKALAIRRKVLGEEHPDTATTYGGVAFCLDEQGQYAQALPLHEKALAIRRKVLGEEHPLTAASYNNLAYCLALQGRLPEALLVLQTSLPGQEAARFHTARSGFDRAFASARHLSAHQLLAVGLARLGQPGNAFRHAEAHLARGLLDDLAPRDRSDEAALAALFGRLTSLDGRLIPLFGRGGLSEGQQRLRDELTAERRLVQAEMVRRASAVSARQLLGLAEIQEQLPADCALVLWLDAARLGRPWACVVRRRGRPVWVPLPGSGKGGAWTAEDRDLPARLYRLLQGPPARAKEGKRLEEHRRRLVEALSQQRLGPLRPHLKGVRRLLVVPTGWASRVPLEVLDTGYRISYVPSGSAFARLRRLRPAVGSASLLALGDPAFAVPAARRPEPPARGVMLGLVRPGGSAHRAGLRPGDVLLSVGEAPIATLDDLKKALAVGGAVRYWREGEQQSAHLPAGALGASPDVRPAPQAVAAWREATAPVVRHGPAPLPLPGTRWEVEALGKLVPHATRLLGRDASAKRLAEMAEKKELKGYRLVHLATHGRVDDKVPGRSALLLAERGELSVAAVRKGWELDCDLVVLSACQTALGAEGRGDGLLGFAQAFLQAGARCVVLARWNAHDTATALLMVRFYENLLGRRKGLTGPLPRAEALEEARAWLRALPRREASRLAGALRRGKLSGTRVSVVELEPKEAPAGLPEGERPYEHPFYWATFVLVGDPD